MVLTISIVAICALIIALKVYDSFKQEKKQEASSSVTNPQQGGVVVPVTYLIDETPRADPELLKMHEAVAPIFQEKSKKEQVNLEMEVTESLEKKPKKKVVKKAEKPTVKTTAKKDATSKKTKNK